MARDFLACCSCLYYSSMLLGTHSIWWFPAPLSQWTSLKTVILYIVAKFYSWMSFLIPTCNSQGKSGVFPETPSHQTIEFLKPSTKCLYNLLYIHQQGRAYFCMAVHTRLIVRASLVALALPVVTTWK